jgi:sugar lactone lactonase YvrE
MKAPKQLHLLLFLTAFWVMISSCSKSTTTKKNSNLTVSTFAGTGSSGAADGTGTAASFSFPSSVAIGPSGNLYVGDFGNSLVRSINLSTVGVTTYAGSGVAGFVNGPALTAEFNGTANIVPDGSGNVFVSDEQNNVIREITSAGNVITVAGSGVSGYQDGPSGNAEFNHPEGMVLDGSGNLFVADGHNNVIRKIILSSGEVSTYAGTGTAGFNNGTLSTATFYDPYGLILDAAGNIYVADIQNNAIRKITVSSGTVSTFAGTGAQGLTNGPAASATFYYPLGCVFDSNGDLYVCDTYNNVIRKVSASGMVTTYAGTGVQGSTDGPAASASFNFPIGIAISGSFIFVADTHNNTIRKISID